MVLVLAMSMGIVMVKGLDIMIMVTTLSIIMPLIPALSPTQRMR